MFFYKSYPYAPLATVFSFLNSLLGLLMGAGAIAMFSDEEEEGAIAAAVMFLVLAVVFFVLSFVVSKKIAEKMGKKNIETKASYGLKFCQAHPEEYEAVAAVNAAFAAQYERNAEGRIVKRAAPLPIEQVRAMQPQQTVQPQQPVYPQAAPVPAPQQNAPVQPVYPQQPVIPPQPVQQPVQQPVYQQAPQPAAPVQQPAADPVDQLMRYKTLLDNGAITQDDYNRKKAELLGL